MKERSRLKLAITVFMAALIMQLGCSRNSSNIVDNDTAGSVKLNLAYTLGGSFAANQSKTTRGSAGETFMGELVVRNVATSVAQPFRWYASIDEELLTISSNKTVILNSGTYDISLSLSKGNHTYYGELSAVALGDDTSNVAIVLKPVIGQVNTSVKLSQIPALRFNYESKELTDLTKPKIGVIVDSAAEILIDINKSTGLGEVYYYPPAGQHTIELKLYDGNLQVGRSVVAQQNDTVTLGEDISIDIVALHTEVAFDLAVEGGNAVFKITVPNEFVDEAGSPENLKTVFTLVSDVQETMSSLVSLAKSGNDYAGTVTFSEFKYCKASLALSFEDIKTKEVLGTGAVKNVVMNKNAQSVVFDIELIRRSVSRGNILAVLKINVVDKDYAPVTGAKIYINKKLVGLTGSNSLGTEGYWKQYILNGNYTVRAEANGYYGEASISADPLGIINIDLVLEHLIIDPNAPRIEIVPTNSHPSIPAGLKMTTLVDPDQLSPSSTCPVIKCAGLTYWAYSHRDNRNAFTLVGYDKNNKVIKSIYKTGARYLWKMELDAPNSRIRIYGQARRSVQVTYSELLPQ